MNDVKIADLTKRMLKLSTSSNMSIAEVASAHYNCLAGLALEAADGDKDVAEKYIRAAIEELITQLSNPAMDVRLAVQKGKVVGHR